MPSLVRNSTKLIVGKDGKKAALETLRGMMEEEGAIEAMHADIVERLTELSDQSATSNDDAVKLISGLASQSSATRDELAKSIGDLAAQFLKALETLRPKDQEPSFDRVTKKIGAHGEALDRIAKKTEDAILSAMNERMSDVVEALVQLSKDMKPNPPVPKVWHAVPKRENGVIVDMKFTAG